MLLFPSWPRNRHLPFPRDPRGKGFSSILSQVILPSWGHQDKSNALRPYRTQIQGSTRVSRIVALRSLSSWNDMDHKSLRAWYPKWEITYHYCSTKQFTLIPVPYVKFSSKHFPTRQLVHFLMKQTKRKRTHVAQWYVRKRIFTNLQ